MIHVTQKQPGYQYHFEVDRLLKFTHAVSIDLPRCNTSKKSWRGYIFTAFVFVCVCVCVCVCVSVCVSVSKQNSSRSDASILVPTTIQGAEQEELAPFTPPHIPELN